MGFFILTYKTSFTLSLTFSSPHEIYWIIIKLTQRSERTFSQHSLLSIWGVKPSVLGAGDGTPQTWLPRVQSLALPEPWKPELRVQSFGLGPHCGHSFSMSCWGPCSWGCVTIPARERRSKFLYLWCRSLSPGKLCWEPWMCLYCVAAISPKMEFVHHTLVHA